MRLHKGDRYLFLTKAWIKRVICKVLLQKQAIGIKSKASLQIDRW
ncbi:hypothetical protein PY364_11200 [Kamptonema sp. UHCC 0994]|nr:hypothetical protein [Kamptonema sp. UHCC 0994]